MEDTSNEQLIEEMLAEAEDAPEPGVGDRIIHRGDENQPAPMTVSELASAGWVYIYDTKDGDRSIANRNMLSMLLDVRYPDGSRRFTTRKLPYEPKAGTYKCMLHADDPNRSHYDEMGLPTCRKRNLTNPYMVTQHMRKRHQREWEAIEQERMAKEKAEDRHFQQMLYNTVAKPEEERPLYVSKKDREKGGGGR